MEKQDLLYMHAELLRLGKRVVSLREVYEPGNRYGGAFAEPTRRAMRALVRMGLAKAMPAGTVTSRGRRGREVFRLMESAS